MYWSCRRRTSAQNTLSYTRYFNAEIDSNGLLFLFIYISENYLQFRKRKHCYAKCLVYPIKVTGSTCCGMVFQTMYITLKRIAKVLFLSVLRILLICKF